MAIQIASSWTPRNIIIEKLKFMRLKSKKQGFTLLEIVVALGIFLMILIPVMDFIQSIVTSQQIMFTEASSQKEARKSLDDFVKEVRNASASSIGSYVIAEATATSFTFYSDIDSDTYKERVRYFITGSNLNKGVIKPSGNPLIYNIGAEVITTVTHDLTVNQQPFTYYDKNYLGTNSALVFPINVVNVRVVKVKLNIDQKANRSPEPLNVETQVEIRNLKYAN